MKKRNQKNNNTSSSSAKALKPQSQKKKIAFYASLTTLLILLIATATGLTYSYFTDSAKPVSSVTFGVLEVGVDFTDSIKNTSTFSVNLGAPVTPGQDVPLQGSISSQIKLVNNNISDSTLNAYLRFRFEITGFEDSACTIPISEELQEDLNAVAQNVKVLQGNTKWAKAGDGYIYYSNGSEANHKLKWAPAQTVALNNEILLNFPTSFFRNSWQSKTIKVTIKIETFQYDLMEIDYSSCADLTDQANCASSIILDYDRITGLGVDDRIVATAYCASSVPTFTANQQFQTEITGKTSTLKVYSEGKKLTQGTDYSLSGNTLTVYPLPHSVLVVCDPQIIELVNSTDQSQIYETLVAGIDGSIPKYVAVPVEGSKAFMGFFTSPNGIGTKIYDPSGRRLIATTNATRLYSHFVTSDIIVEYRDTYQAFEGPTAFQEAFDFIQTLTATDITLTTFINLTLAPSQPWRFNTNNKRITIQGAKSSENNYPAVTVSPTMSNNNVFVASQGGGASATGNTIKFQNLNFTYKSANSNRFFFCKNNTIYIGQNTTFTNFTGGTNNGSVIYLDAGDSVLKIYGANAGVKDVVFTNCTTTNYGGAISGSSTSTQQSLIVNAQFTSCSSNMGGAISKGGTYPLTIENSEFVSNSATTNGGAIYQDGGTIAFTSGIMKGNQGSRGGAYYLNSGTFNMTGGQIGDTQMPNISIDKGGAIYQASGTYNFSGGCVGDQTKATATTGNYATGTAGQFANKSNLSGGVAGGAGIFSAGNGTLNMTGTACVAYNYTAGRAGGIHSDGTLNINSKDVHISFNNANAEGGGISTNGNGQMTFTAGNIHNNRANLGGGIRIGWNCDVDGKKLINGSDAKIFNNTASGGGGIFLEAWDGGGGATQTARGGNIRIEAGQIYSNNVTSSGGGFFINSRKNTASNTEGLGKLVITGGRISGNTANLTGGGIYSNAGIIEISGGFIEDNTSTNEGGGIIVRPNDNLSSQITMTGGEISGNRTTGASMNGGGIWLYNQATMNFSGGKISNNIATGHGGGVFLEGGATLTMSGTAEISDNSTTSKGTLGGGIYASAQSVLNLNGGAINRNTSTGGGAIYSNSSVINFTAINIVGNQTIKIVDANNEGTNSGGAGIYLTGSGTYILNGNINIMNNNTNGGRGGAIRHATSPILRIQKAQIIGNTAKEGGGIGTDSGSVQGRIFIEPERDSDVVFSGNTATEGGCVHLYGRPDGNSAGLTVTGGTFVNNTATSAGGVFRVSCSTTTGNRGKLTITGGIFGDNGQSVATASNCSNKAYRGGAIFSTGAEVTISNATFGRNFATNTNDANGGGGAIWHQTSADGGFLRFSGINEFKYCGASASGGAIWNNGEIIFDVGSVLNFHHNKTAVNGGAIYTQQPITIAEGMSLYSNQAQRGGALYCRNTTTTITGGMISENTASTLGGGVCVVMGGTFTMSGGTITENTAVTGGGGICAERTEELYPIVQLTLSGTASVIQNHLVKTINITSAGSAQYIDSIGAGIIVNGNGSRVTIGGNSKIENNTISNTVTISSAVTVNCSARTYGAGVYSAGNATNSFIIKESASISNNEVSLLQIQSAGSGATNSTAYGVGVCSHHAGLLEIKDSVKIQNNKVRSISAVSTNTTTTQVTTTSVQGIGVMGFNIQMGAGTISGNTIISNTATTPNATAKAMAEVIGGGIASISSAGGLTITGGTIANNSVVPQTFTASHANGATTNVEWRSNGGGIIHEQQALSISDLTLSNNNAHYGGGLFIKNGTGTMSVSNITISENSVNHQGGGIYVGNGAVNISNAEITGNTAGGSGGGIYHATGTTTMEDSLLNRNTAVDEGGGMVLKEGTGIVRNTIFGDALRNGTGFFASADNFGNKSGGQGGGLKSEDAKLTIDNCEFAFNYAGDNGGGFAYVKGTSGNGTVTLKGTINVHNNASIKSGGGIFFNTAVLNSNELIKANVYSNKSYVDYASISDARGGGGICAKSGITLDQKWEVYSNEAVRGGGVLFNNAGTYTLSGIVIRNNSAVTNHAYGGGLYITTGTTTINNGTVIRGNTTSGVNYGGGITTKDNTTNNVIIINNATITENLSASASGLYVSVGTTLNFQAGTISNNNATSDNGGGVLVKGSMTISGGTISGNSAQSNGGGVYVTGTFTMSGGTISENSAENGGGIYCSGVINLSGGLITENIASINGGGIMKSGTGIMTISGGTISNNTAARGGGLRLNGGTTNMTNGTIRGNASSVHGGGVYLDTGYVFNLSGGNVINNTAGGVGGGVYVNTNGTGFHWTGGTITGNTPSNTHGNVQYT